MLAFPSLLLALFLIAVVGPSNLVVVAALAILYIPGFMRFARGLALQLRERSFVEASHISGGGPLYIVRRHLLPNAVGPLLVSISLTAAYSLLAAATLSYLGLGAPPPAPSWGSMSKSAYNYLFQDWWYGVMPGACIVIVSCGYLLISAGIEHAIQRGSRTVQATGGRASAGGVSPPVRAVALMAAPASDAVSVGDGRRDPVLRIEGLLVEYPIHGGVVRAVDDLSLELGRGQRLALVGESGSGKSTVALAVLGLLEPPGHVTAGSIRLGELELAGASEDAPARRARRPDLDDLPGRARLAEPGEDDRLPAARGDPPARRADRRTEARDRAIALLAEVGVQTPADRLGQYPHEFSGGMRQRVMIAMALASNPELLIADEPTTALDVTTQASVIDLLVRLSEERDLAVLLITHDLGIVAGFSQDVLVMYAGAPVEYGPTGSVFAEAGHPYTQALIAAVPRLTDERGTELASIPGSLPPADAIPPRLPLRGALPDRPRPRPLPQRAAGVRLRDRGAAASRATSSRRRGTARRRVSTRPVIEPRAAPVAAGAALVQIADLAKSYRARGGSAFGRRYLRAVDGVSFEISPGESLGLVGESGSGKSTVARLLLGLTDRTRGHGRLRGPPARGQPARRPRQGAPRPRADGLPGSGRLARSDDDDRLDRRRAALPAARRGAQRRRRPRPASCSSSSASSRRSAGAGRSSSPAGSGSASRSPGRSPPTRR